MNASVQLVGGGDAKMEPDALVAEVVDAVAAGEPAAARMVLHPYLHWTERGMTIRGRTTLLRSLTTRTSLAPPARVEVRDGQIYRWIADE